MKTLTSIMFLYCFLVCFSFQIQALDYTITFSGSGARFTIDSVVVQNLYKGTQVTVPGGSQLHLTDNTSGFDILNSITAFAYAFPNPFAGNSTFTFLVKKEGDTQISIYSMDGKKVSWMDIFLSQGEHSFQLTLPKGLYLIQTKGNGFLYTTKIISLSMETYKPIIIYNGNLPITQIQKIGNQEVKFYYTSGDQL